MTNDQPPPRKRNSDTTAARRASVAAFTRRRHERYAREMRPYGVTVIFLPEYTGLPLTDPEEAKLADAES